jgi:hypothetical protein
VRAMPTMPREISEEKVVGARSEHVDGVNDVGVCARKERGVRR